MAASGVAAAGQAQPLDDLLGRLRDLEDEGARRPLLLGALQTHSPDALATALKAEAERLWTVDPRASVRVSEAIALCGELAARPELVALGVMARGDALRLLGRYPESLDLLDEAGERFLALGDEVGWARTRIGRVVSAQLLGQGASALADVDRAREVLVGHGEWLRAASLDVNTAVVCRRLGRFDDALRLYDQAQQTYEALGPAAALRVAGAKMNRAVLLTYRGQFRPALALHQEARAVFAGHGDTVSMLRIDQNAAWVHAGLGDYTRSLRLLADALGLAEQNHLEANAGQIALDMVECYLSLNRHADAATLAEEAAGRFERCGTPTEAARARFYVALAAARLGETERAAHLFEALDGTFSGAGLTAELAMTVLQRATLHLAEGAWEAAASEARRAQALFSAQRLAVHQVQAALVRSRAALHLGQLHRAERLARTALAMTREREAEWLTHESHHILARVAEARRDSAGALSAYAEAVSAIEHVQRRQANQLRANFLDDKLAVYHDAIDLSLRLDRPSLAFEYLERAKSRALVDYLAGNPEVRLRARGGADQTLLDELSRLRQEHNWFYSRLYGRSMTHGGRPESDASGVRVLESAIRERETRIARILERLTLHAHDLEGLAAPPPPQVIQPPVLGPRTVQLEYYFRPAAGAVFVLSAGTLVTVPLEIGSAGVQTLLRRWQFNLDATARALAQGASLNGLQRNAVGILGTLYRALVQPVEAYLSGQDRLIVVPYGAAHAVPWHALFDGERHLLERVEVVTGPSSSLLRLCASRRRPPGREPGSALVVAFSAGGRLPHVLDEAQMVARLLPGEAFLEEAATGARLVTAAPRHGIVHLAAHGEARLDNPAFAHLQLADGQLTTADVFNLGLDGALVTLSACETGRSVVTGGDELIGLARGFLYAGAATLVQSLWRVEDGSTARLMEHFYLALQGGRSPAAALRRAQLSLLEEGLPPYIWAPFQLAGDPGPLPATGPRSHAPARTSESREKKPGGDAP